MMGFDGLLAGDVAVVTGAGRGNGFAIARGLARAGAAVALLDIDPDTLATARREIEAAGGKAMSAMLDVGDRGACRDVAEKVRAELGPPSILINNAGILRREPIDSERFEETWNEVLRINLSGCMNMAAALVAQLRETKGRIVNIGSIASFVGSPRLLAYTASKGAVLQLTRTLAAELGPAGIRVNGLAPGRFITPMTEDYRDDPAGKATYFARTPLGRYGEPEDLVGPALFLVSPMSAYVTGVMLPVDGGYLAD